MFMKKYHYLLTILFTLFFVSCFEDETTIADMTSLSEITIKEGSIKAVYNINKNETLVISPELSQSNKEKPLKYTWEIDLEEYSYEKELNYYGDKLGEYNCRFIVENEDGKTFFPFKLFVNSPYEEGITILSADSEGRPMLSFMQTPAVEGETGTFTTEELLTLNNSEMEFASNPSDMIQSGNTLFLVCKGGGTGADAPTIYYLNEKTFVVESMFEVRDYADFKPTKLLMPSTWGAYVDYPVICENGNVYGFSPFEAAVGPSTNLSYNYSQAVSVDDGDYYYDMILWDNDANALALIYGGYGPFYFSNEYHLSRSNSDFKSLNYFTGHNLVTIVPVKMSNDEVKLNGYEAIVLTKNSIMNYALVIGTDFWGYNSTNGTHVLRDNGGFKMVGFGNVSINDNTPCIASKTYQTMFFAEGNKVRKWNYTTSQQITAAATHLSVGSDDAVITGFEMSADQNTTYVTFYEPGKEGKNGSLWAFDTDKGTVLNKWENISYKPVKMFYKNK